MLVSFLLLPTLLGETTVTLLHPARIVRHYESGETAAYDGVTLRVPPAVVCPQGLIRVVRQQRSATP